MNWQVVGVPDKAEKDEIVKSVMQLKNAQVEEGYTMDAVMSRQVGNRDWNLWFFLFAKKMVYMGRKFWIL